MIEIRTSRGTTTNAYGSTTHVTFYSVLHNNQLVIRTSNRELALREHDRLIGPAVNTRDVEANSSKRD